MSAINFELPDDLMAEIAGRAAERGVTEVEWLQEAAREKLASDAAQRYLDRRAARGNRAAYDRALSKVPDVDPVSGDER